MQIVSVVTGANGFVGSHMVDHLLEQGHQVKCIVRKNSDLKWLEGKEVQIFPIGLDNQLALRDVLKDADYIYHIAGLVKSRKMDTYFRANVDMTKNLLDAAIFNDNIKKIIITSSLAATGPAKKNSFVDEYSPLAPIEPYGFSKVAQEKLALEYSHLLPVSIVRPAAVYGERDSEILPFFKMISRGWSVRMGFDNKELSLVHVKDLVNGMYRAAIHPKDGEIYFLGSPEPYNWKQVAEICGDILNINCFDIAIPHSILYTAGAIGSLLERLSGRNLSLNLDRAKRITRPSWCCSSEKAMKELQYYPELSLEDGIRQTLDWYKKESWI